MNDPTAHTGCRDLLAAIREALVIPFPATGRDERAYLQIRSDRASAAAATIDMLADDASQEELAKSAEILRGAIRNYPTDRYVHLGVRPTAAPGSVVGQQIRNSGP